MNFDMDRISLSSYLLLIILTVTRVRVVDREWEHP